MDTYDRARRIFHRKMKNAEKVIAEWKEKDMSAQYLSGIADDLTRPYKMLEELVESEYTDHQGVLKDFDDVEVMYTNLSLQLDNMKVSIENANVPANQAANSADQVSKPSTHLKKMNVPIFDGSVRGYLHFKKMFKLIVSDKGDDEIALLRLQEECLKKDSIEYFIVKSKESLSAAWTALDDKYLRTGVIKDSILQDIKDIPVIKKKTDAMGMRKLVTVVSAAEQDLKASDSSACLGDAAFAHLRNKIPKNMRRDIEEEIITKKLDANESIKFLLKSCELEATIQERGDLRDGAHSVPVSQDKESTSRYTSNKCFCAHSVEYSKNDASSTGESSGDESQHCLATKSASPRKGRISNCVIHPNLTSHSTAKCHDFLQRKSAKEKRDILDKNGRCLKCFGTHSTEHCKSDIKCQECDGEHSTLIHLSCVQILSQTLETPISDSDIGEFLGQHTVRPGHRAFLKAKQTASVNILYDSCATVSQVVTSVAEAAGLQPVNVISNLRMKTAGRKEAEDWGPSKLFNVPIYDTAGVLVITVKCVGVGFIGHTDKYVNDVVAKEFADAGLNPADILKPVRGDIHLLIGNNHPEYHPEPIAAKGKVIWARTMFGYVLHGSHPHFACQKISDSAKNLTISTALLSDLQLEPVLCESPPEYLGVEPGLSTSKARSADADTSDLVLRTYEEPFVGEIMTLNSTMDKNRDNDTTCIVCSAKIAEDAFDRWCTIDDQSVCSVCKKCLPTTIQHMSPEDDRKIKIYRDCVQYDPDLKRFTAKMPWTKDYSTIPDNYTSAHKRLMSLCKSMDKDEYIKKWYKEEFEKVINAGILREVLPEEDAQWRNENGKVWYVSHFHVLNQNSSSTPLRLIFDPTISFKGFVINNMWESPPNLIPQIPSLILRFRERAVPIAMDISKAYWSVYLEKQESHLHRVIWNGLDANEKPKIYRMLKNSWGSRPAGSIMSVAIQKLADYYQDRFPHVHEFLYNQLYVDDGTYSVDTIDEAYRLAVDTCFVLGEGSFHVKHFIIGGKSVSVDAERVKSSSQTAPLPTQVRLGNDTERVLGLLWHPSDDEISLSCHVNFSPKRKGIRTSPDIDEMQFESNFPDKITQRMYLSVISSLYDVCGLGTPATIVLKHELGRIFRMSLGWDTPLPSDSEDDSTPSRKRCMELIKMLYGLAKVRFYRCLKPLNGIIATNPILVVFCDSSQMAYASVAYVNWQTTDGKRVSRIALAKAHPFPKRPPLLTIPRGEMMGLVTGVRLKNTILRSLTYQFSRIVFITDSSVALGQIGHDPSKFNPWMAGKVQEITESSSVDDFYHVESKLNVADEATRGLFPSQLGTESRWQSGPEFMRMSVEMWPLRPRESFASNSSKPPVELRIKDPRMSSKFVPKSLVCVPSVDSHESRILSVLEYLYDGAQLDPNDSWVKIQRRTARVIECLELLGSRRKELLSKLKDKDECRNRLSSFKGLGVRDRTVWISENDQFCPSKNQLEIASKFWIIHAQKQLPSIASMDRRLNPVRVDGIVRANGRTSSVNHRPVIIPAGNPLADILIHYYHVPAHRSADSTLAILTIDYWLIGGQRRANTLVAKCAFCNTRKKRTTEVEMAPVRAEQVLRYPVFSTVSVDLAGPYITVADRRNTRQNPALSGKIWVLVIVCMSSRAVHLELTEKYDTSAFLQAYDTFTHVRGQPSKVIADLGSQITSASDTMVKLWDHVNRNQVKNHSPAETVWEFIASGNHSALGAAERMVKTFKTCMEIAVYSRKPTFTKIQMARTLYAVADMINDRPLAVGRVRVGKLESNRLIRPNDILIGRSTSDVQPIIPDQDVNISGKSKYIELLRVKEAFLNVFWTKFQEQVFSTLLPRYKWQTTKRQMKINDIVLIKDSNAVRGVWKWGEIAHVFPSSDGIIRSARVRYVIHGTGNKPRAAFAKKSVRDLAIILRSEDR